MPVTCTVLDAGGVAIGNAVCVIGYDAANARPSVARATATNLVTSKTVYGVSRETKGNGQPVAINVSGEVAEDAISGLGAGASSIVVSDHDNGTVASQCVPKRISSAVGGSEAFVIGTCDQAGKLVIQPRHLTDETAFPKVFNVRAYGAVGDGVTDDAPAFQAALNDAAATAGTVYCGPSTAGYMLASGLTVPVGVRLVGSFRGARKGLESQGVTPGGPRGSTLLVSGNYRGRLITLSAMSSVEGVEIFYPEQKTNSTPDDYDWAIFVGDGAHSTNILDVCLVNAFRGIFVGPRSGPVGGCRIDNVWGWCIFQGILLGRCADVTMVTNCEFNVNGWAAAGQNLIAWTKTNGRAYGIDGAEEFMFVNCFCWGYLVGCTFEDLDGDSVVSGGAWLSGGFDTVAVGFLVISGLGMTGVKIQGVDIVPSDSAIKCDDNIPNPIEFQKPRIMIDGLTVHNADTYARALWIRPASHCKVIWTGGFAIDFTIQMLLNEFPNGVLRLFGVENVGAAPRLTNSGGGSVVDLGSIP
jgi:hypothetical protein